MTALDLDPIRARLAAATDGPWAPWLDQDGQPHMNGMLMVGVAAGVIPEGETWVEGPDCNNPVAHVYTPEDRDFIAHSPADIAALVARVEELENGIRELRAACHLGARVNPYPHVQEALATIVADLERALRTEPSEHFRVLGCGHSNHDSRLCPDYKEWCGECGEDWPCAAARDAR